MMRATLVTKKLWHSLRNLSLAVAGSYTFGHPGKELKIYGITGTDGKTTSSTMLYHVLKSAGYKVALISTVAAFIGDEAIDTGFHTTSPEPWQIQKLLRRCVDAGIEHVVLEVTSHGIFQYRVWGLEFALAGLTNITNEHLDYFVDWETYAAVKSQLLENAGMAVINADDRSYDFIAPRLRAAGTPFLEYSQKMGKSAVDQAIQARFPEEYNQWNAHLVLTMAEQLGVTKEQFARAIKDFPGVTGRMEQIPNTHGIKIIVDFAHTPNALEKALTALRPQTKGRLIAVFGSAGLRDRAKRPAMGGVGSRLADLVVFTAEDPRTEDVNVIIRQMKDGVQEPNHRKVVSIPDRGKAIAFALSEAKKGDAVVILGKGHEQSMCFGTTEFPWSDQKAVREWLQT